VEKIKKGLAQALLEQPKISRRSMWGGGEGKCARCLWGGHIGKNEKGQPKTRLDSPKLLWRGKNNGCLHTATEKGKRRVSSTDRKEITMKKRQRPAIPMWVKGRVQTSL